MSRRPASRSQATDPGREEVTITPRGSAIGVGVVVAAVAALTLLAGLITAVLIATT